MSQKSKLNYGFTLIELIVVFSVIAILSVIGIAAYISYGRTQTLNAAASDVFTMLNTAKSRAQSQVKPSLVPCNTSTLDGYTVTIKAVNNGNYFYELNVKCQGSSPVLPLEKKKLPSNISFSNPSDITIMFYVITGGVDSATNITINGYGNEKRRIVIDAIGKISVQSI